MIETEDILAKYFSVHKELVEAETVDDQNLIVSFPLHFAGNTRIELSVTKVTPKIYLISDMARTLGELALAGYSITKRMKDRILEITRQARLEFSGSSLVRKCGLSDLGIALHEVCEGAKTIGDAYLTYRMRGVPAEDESLKDQVRAAFNSSHFGFSEMRAVSGEFESAHQVDFYIAPNGTKGLALNVVSSAKQISAEAWGFKALDIKKMNSDLLVGIVYDANRTKEIGRTIFNRIADIPIPSNELDLLAVTFERIGISGGRH